MSTEMDLETMKKYMNPIIDDIYKLFVYDYQFTRLAKEQRMSALNLIAKQTKKMAKEVDGIDLSKEKTKEFAIKVRSLLIEIIDLEHKESIKEKEKRALFKGK